MFSGTALGRNLLQTKQFTHICTVHCLLILSPFPCLQGIIMIRLDWQSSLRLLTGCSSTSCFNSSCSQIPTQWPNEHLKSRIFFTFSCVLFLEWNCSERVKEKFTSEKSDIWRVPASLSYGRSRVQVKVDSKQRCKWAWKSRKGGTMLPFADWKSWNNIFICRIKRWNNTSICRLKM